MDRSSETRRRFVRGTVGASLLGLAGCAGAPDSGDGETTGAETTAVGDEALPEGVSEEEFVSGPVPGPYRTATSQGGEERDPDSLQAKEAVRFQEAEDAVEAGFITPGPNCGNCAEFIPDQNGDGYGACAKVEGYVDAEDWCVIWQPLEEGGTS